MPFFDSNDQRMELLSHALDLFEHWESPTFITEHKLSSATFHAIILWLKSFISLIHYIFDFPYMIGLSNHKFNYFLPGILQSDPIEHHFGKLRQLNGGNYHISVDQFLSYEKKSFYEHLFEMRWQKF